MPLLLSRRDVESVLTMEDALSAVEDGFRQLALGQVVMPQRTAIRVPAYHGLHLGMPAFIGSSSTTNSTGSALALKVVTVYPDNPSRYGLPTTIGTLLLNDPRSGALLAIMDAGYLTGMRTGAASGVATKYLARSDAKTVGLFGAGIQGWNQVLAVAKVRHLDRVVVCDPSRERREGLADRLSKQIDAELETTGDPAVACQCDILIAATSSKYPLFEGSMLRPGCHVNAIGAHAADTREFDTLAIKRSKVVTDLRSACLQEAGELVIPIQNGEITEDTIHADLGEVLTGSAKGRESAEEITLFKSVGLAVQDAATAARVYQLAREKGIGTEISM